MSDRHIPLQLAGGRVVGVGPMTSPDQAPELLREAIAKIIVGDIFDGANVGPATRYERERGLCKADEILALTRPSPPAGGETLLREALESAGCPQPGHTNEYLTVGKCIRRHRCGCGAKNALAHHPIASESGRETTSSEQVTGDIVERLDKLDAAMTAMKNDKGNRATSENWIGLVIAVNDVRRVTIERLRATPASLIGEREAREKEITRLATIEECASAAFKTYGSISSVVYTMEGPAGLAKRMIAAIRVLASENPCDQGSEKC